MSRKGSKNLTESERSLLISIINDYEVCDLSDKKMVEILSQKLGRSIRESAYYVLKSEAKKNRKSSEQWLDNFCKNGGLVGFYKQRLDETLFVQKELLKLYADEANKKDTNTKQNRILMAKLAKTISDNSKNLSELGMSPVILAKLKSLVPIEILNGDLEYTEKYFEDLDKDQKKLWSIASDEWKTIENDEKDMKQDPSKAPTAIFPPIDNLDEKNSKGSHSGTSHTQEDQRIF